MSGTPRRRRSCTKGVLLCFALFALALFATPSLAAGAQDPLCGAFDVQVLSGGAWRTVDTLGFGLRYSVGTAALPGDVLQVRLVQRGGTGAQIDRVSLDGVAPVAIDGTTDDLALWKVAVDDDDVTDAGAASLTFTFPQAGSRLVLDARSPGDISSMVPVAYPRANLGGPVTAASSFYALDVSALPDAVDTRAEPFLRQMVWPSSGHPAGFTYIWAARDDDALHVTIDFTPDNTCDDADDYATVHVRTASGVRDFRLSTAETTWGDVSFTYTDKVGYQHKLYEFEIPWSSIGAPRGTLDVAFTTYGTVAIQPVVVHRFYNKLNTTHFYTASEVEKDDVIARLGAVYEYEGIAWVIPSNPQNDMSVYRFHNKALGYHFYTASDVERDNVLATLSNAYVLEGVAFRACPFPANVTVWRLRDTRNGSHFYTASAAERDAVLASMPGAYVLEGVGFHIAGL